MPIGPVSPGASRRVHGLSYRFQRLGSANQTPSAWTLLRDSSMRIDRAVSSGKTAAGRSTSVTVSYTHLTLPTIHPV